MPNLTAHKKLIITGCVAVVAISGASFYAGATLTKDKKDNTPAKVSTPKKASVLSVGMLESNYMDYLNKEVAVQGRLIMSGTDNYSIVDTTDNKAAGYVVDVSRLSESPAKYFTKMYSPTYTPPVVTIKGTFSATVKAEGGLSNIRIVADSLTEKAK